MEDYKNIRNQIKKNYLKNLIIRLDFEDIIEFDSSTIKDITLYLREKNFEKNTGVFNEFSFKLNKEIKSIEDAQSISFDTLTKEVLVFNNNVDKIKIEICPFLIVINKYDKFDADYQGFEYFANLLIDLLTKIKNNEKISETRLGIRKINTYEHENIEIFNNYFQDYVLGDFYKMSLPKNSINYAKRYTFESSPYFINYQVNIRNGVIFKENNQPKDVYQLKLDFDIYKDSNICNDNLKEDLINMNTNLFNYYINAYKKDIINNYIINNKLLFE